MNADQLASASKILTIAIELEHLSTDMDHAGISITRLENTPYDLLDIVLDMMDFLPAKTPFERDGETYYTERQYLHDFFFNTYRKLTPDQMIQQLGSIKTGQELLGEKFNITEWFN